VALQGMISEERQAQQAEVARWGAERCAGEPVELLYWRGYAARAHVSTDAYCLLLPSVR
jgi:hypothetical protein